MTQQRSTPKDLAKGTSHMTDDPQRSSRNSSGNPIRTWHERCEAHPDHEGIVTNAMVQARMQEEIDELRAALSERGLCHWKPDQDGVYWTTCGNAFTFIDAGPSANKMKFCCYCGGTMSEQRFERSD